ncbi:collagen alpha-4(VI) chain-like [Argonauta hians]
MRCTVVAFFLATLLAVNAASLKDVDELMLELERDVGSNGDVLSKGCEGSPADIVFIIDSSRSIPPQDFVKQVKFIGDVVGTFHIGPTETRIGAVTFGQQIIIENTFGLSKYTDESSLKTGISNIDFKPRYGGSTETALAISYARKNIFNNARPGVQKIGIVLTDGVSTYRYKTIAEAGLAKKEGILMMAIGVGRKIDMEELKGIASGKDYVFTVDSFDALQQIKVELGMKTCPAPTTVAPPPTTPEPTTTTTTPEPTTTTTTPVPTTPMQKDEPCDKDIDINFVFAANTIGDKSTNDVIKFIKSSISSNDLKKNNIRVGTVAGSCKTVYGFSLNKYSTKAEVIQHFDQFHETHMAPLVVETYKDAFTASNGGRSGARKVAVFFLKGKLTDPLAVVEKAKLARESGVEIYVVPLDQMNDRAILEAIVSPPDGDHIITGSGLDMMALSGEFSRRLCTSKKPACD